jgi:hypothetical protein
MPYPEFSMRRSQRPKRLSQGSRSEIENNEVRWKASVVNDRKDLNQILNDLEVLGVMGG